jgi:signal transduction histidine kinase
MFGERDDPYAVLSRLGRRLEETLAPDSVLPSIAETIREALKLPYAAIMLAERNGLSYLAASGTVTDGAIHVPLVYQQEPVGELILAPRAPGETFSAGDRRLLEDLARQVGVAAHNVRLAAETMRLNADLQRSRERLVTAREEERRRLRRELHDGLAPTLAALNLQAGQIKGLLRADPQGAESLADAWRADMRATIASVRRLAYELRPPVLDELGLVAAIEERARRAGGLLRVTVDAPAALGALPAAVEVAAFRIAQEALTNVEPHANAHTCIIKLWVADGSDSQAALTIEVSDDGVGLPPAARHRSGVGIVSMRERAEELGGTCLVESRPGGGTRVWACLPLGQE